MRIVLLLLLSLVSLMVSAGPEQDRLAFRAYFEQRFPDLDINAHADGAYALDAQKREQWLAMEDFPPYEFTVDDGMVLFQEPFADGATYGDCFADEGAVKHQYPVWDDARKMVVTLELAINDCRSLHGEAPLPYGSEEMMQLTAYMAFVSRDRAIAIEVPPEAEAAYNQGKQYYYSRRGQLNFACSHCHLQMSGMNLRAERLSASIGQVTHWPTYRLKWQAVGPLHRRYARCNEQVGSEGLPFQHETYRNLEFFMTYMSNGLPINGPATRK